MLPEMATEVHQCPFCELRFLSRYEMVDHIDEAHPRPQDDDGEQAGG